MSHLTHEVCGCDFFISYSYFNCNVAKLGDSIKDYFKKHKLSFYSLNSFSYNENYWETLRVQSIRCKIFLFIIDKYSLENDLLLCLYQYAKVYSRQNHLPVIIPVIFENFNIELNQNDSNKFKIVEKVLNDSIINFKYYELSSIEHFLSLLKESIQDLIPFKTYKLIDRYDDRFRPLTLNEQNFLSQMKTQELNVLKKMEISKINLKTLYPREKSPVALSLQYDELKSHVSTMLNADYHLTWIDIASINKINYYNLIWSPNDESCLNYIIFFDLNPAQLEYMYKEYSVDNNWNLELIESYVKYHRPSLIKRKKLNRIKSTNKSHDEILYFCQFRHIENSNNKTKLFNTLKHSIIDTRFDDVYKKSTESLSKKQAYMPIRINRVLIDVNTINNKHFYYTLLLKPVNLIQKLCYDKRVSQTYDEDKEVLLMDKIYQIRNNLNDDELMKCYEDFSRMNWRLVDIKALKDENFVSKFSTIWTCYENFYEGTSNLCVGLTQNELAEKIKQFKVKNLYPKFVTNYGYLNSKGEHVYTVYFSQE
ncbi:unnamed protein product [Brachionus calyciflorus]|uniref:TIR domain-containing protein n=1 Tax=Brachionus calyciflorus TaxID=104777 RepID=A0A814D1L4_9BILA|nr:unnamed protein product [Brachionus calyciflorus]